MYIYDGPNGFDIWDYNSDDVSILIVFGITWVLCAAACFLLVITALRSNRGRILGVLSFSLILIAPIITFFVPFAFPDTYCKNNYEYYGNSSSLYGQSDNGPCSQIWGTEGNTSWGMYYAWYLIIIAAIGTLAMFIVGLIAPNPVEDEEYTPITNSGY